MPTERGSYGAQDSAIAPELKESIANSAPITIGAAANGEKGLDGSIAEFRVFRPRHQRRRSSPCRLVARDSGGSVERERRSSTVRREGRAEALLPDARRCGIQVAVGGVRARQRRASRDRVALEHRDGDGRAPELEGSGASAVSRNVRSTARELLDARHPVVPAADGAGAAAEPARASRDGSSIASNPLFSRVTREPALAGDVRRRTARVG